MRHKGGIVCAAVAFDPGQRHAVGFVQPPAPEHPLLGLLILHRIKNHPVQADRVRVPILWILLDPQGLVQPPGRQRERAVADIVFRPRPAVGAVMRPAVRFDGGRMNRIKRVMVQHAEEIRSRFLQGHHQRARVLRLHPHRVYILQVPGVVGPRVFDPVQHIGIGRAQPGRKHPAEAVHKIIRGHRIAVGPAGVFPQIKAVHPSVLRNCPAFRHARHRLQRLCILSDQPLQQRADHIVFRHAGGEMRVKTLQLTAVAQMQNPLAVSLRHPRPRRHRSGDQHTQNPQ